MDEHSWGGKGEVWTKNRGPQIFLGHSSRVSLHTDSGLHGSILEGLGKGSIYLFYFTLFHPSPLQFMCDSEIFMSIEFWLYLIEMAVTNPKPSILFGIFCQSLTVTMTIKYLDSFKYHNRCSSMNLPKETYKTSLLWPSDLIPITHNALSTCITNKMSVHLLGNMFAFIHVSILVSRLACLCQWSM